MLIYFSLILYKYIIDEYKNFTAWTQHLEITNFFLFSVFCISKFIYYLKIGLEFRQKSSLTALNIIY